MQTAVPLACFLSVIRPPGVQYENSLLQIAPVDKSKCPYVKDGNDVAFQLFTRYNPTVQQDLKVGDDEKLFASNMDFHDKTVLYFHAWMETPEDGSAVMVREAYMQRGDTNVIMVDARSLQAGPWYFTAAQNTWYIGRFAGQFIDYLVSRGLNLNNTHLVGHSLGAHVAGVAGSALKSGKVARITGLDAALPLFDNLPLEQRLDPTDAQFVDTVHTDAGIFGYKVPLGHVDFYPNAGISPQPGCELEVVLPQQMLLNKCDARKQTNGFYTYYLKGKQESTYRRNSLEYKLEKLFTFIQAVRTKRNRKASEVTLDKVKANIDSLNDFKDGIIDYLNYYDEETDGEETGGRKTDNKRANENVEDDSDEKDDDNMKKSDKTDDKNTTVIKHSFNNKNEHNSDTIGDGRKDNNEQVNITLDMSKEVVIEDQIAEESDIYAKDQIFVQVNKTILKIDDKSNVKTRTKRDIDLSSHKSEDVELTVVSGNLTLTNNKTNTGQDSVLKNNRTKEETIMKIGKEENFIKERIVTTIPESEVKPTVNTEDDFEISIEDGEELKTKDRKKSSPFRINLFRPRPILRQLIRLIPRISKNGTPKNKSPKFSLLNRDSDKANRNAPKIGFKFNPFNSKKKNILKRQKRFLPFFQRSEDSNNILFRMLDFLIKNRKNVLPVFTVMREINTIVKSANGELNHNSRESNNYIGATPPAFTPITYSLELGNENRVTAFVKKLFGVIPKGDRLTIAGGK